MAEQEAVEVPQRINVEPLRTFGDPFLRESRVTALLNKELGIKPEEKRKPPLTFLGTKPLPVTVVRDEPGPEGSRIIQLERCFETTIRNEETGEEKTIPICHQTGEERGQPGQAFDRTTLECIKELPSELIKEATTGGRPPTARETVRAILACYDGSMNQKTLSLLTGLPEDQVRRALKELRDECLEAGRPENCVVESPPKGAGVTTLKEVSAKIGIGRTQETLPVILPQTDVDALGLALFQMNANERNRMQEKYCGRPCMQLKWWVRPVKE